MRLLQITPEAPDYNSGGKMGVAQTAISLSANGWDVDYIGPEIENADIKKLYNKIYELSPSDSKLLMLFDLLRGVINRRYRAWKRLNINYDMYDAVVLDFTKQDYVLEKVNPDKLYVRVHNIEFDYSSRDYITNKTLKKYIVKALSKRAEKNLIKNAHCLIMLTNHDADRINMLYGDTPQKFIVPVCVNNKCKNDLKVERNELKVNLLITGSLWFGENYNGIVWFIDNVCPLIKSKFRLVIAGSRPPDALKKLIKDKNQLELVNSPEVIDSYFEQCDLVIAPVFNGAGMKVKVAEALSYGKPVVGTNHAFEGYDICDNVNSYVANTKEEFANAIDKYAKMPAKKREDMFNEIRKLFLGKYDLKVSRELWKNILEK